jgi:hypothetical protein
MKRGSNVNFNSMLTKTKSLSFQLLCMHNLFSNEEEGLDKIHDGRFPAHSHSLPSSQKGALYTKTNSLRLSVGFPTSTWNVPYKVGIQTHCTKNS